MVPHPLMASVLAGTLAEGVPLPVELSAMAIIVVVVRWFIRRTDRSDTDTQARLAALEARCTSLEQTVDKERTGKHEALADAAGLRSILRAIRRLTGILDPATLATTLPHLLDEVP